MSKKEHGGPAFPTPKIHDFEGNIAVQATLGMTLRDWFAGQALVGVFLIVDRSRLSMPIDDLPRITAEEAYAVADAMLSERER